MNAGLNPAWYKEKIISRFPPRRDILAVYGFIVFVVYSWTMLSSAWKFPSWMLFLDTGQILSVYAYSFVFDFIESVLILFALLVIAAILPARFWKTNFVSNGVLAIVIIIASLLFHTYFSFIKGDLIEFISTQKFWLVGTVFLAIVAVWVLSRIPWLRVVLQSAADHCLIFLYVYPALTLICLVVVIARNFVGF
jgi:Tfp pilus assembly protein PilZ